MSENNLAAIAFYQKLGFVIDGVHEFRMGDGVDNDYIMKRRMNEAAAFQHSSGVIERLFSSTVSG